MNVRQAYESNLKAEVASRAKEIAHLTARRNNAALSERIQISYEIDALEDKQKAMLKRLDELTIA